MTKALVAYDTAFGNTEKVAKALASGLETGGVEAQCVKVDKVELDKLREYDLLAVGSPTQAFGIFKPVKEFLERLKSVEGLRGKKAFAFDTRIKSRLGGSAAKGIEKRLTGLGLNIVRPHASAVVKGREGPLEDSAEEAFKQIGSDLAKTL